MQFVQFPRINLLCIYLFHTNGKYQTLQFQYPFSGIGHHLENEIFDILKNANKNMNTYTQGPYQEKFEKDFSFKFNQSIQDIIKELYENEY